MSTTRTQRSSKTLWRRKFLAIGGLGAMLGLSAQVRTALASHDDVASIGIGEDNPEGSGPSLAMTLLRTSTQGLFGFEVRQAQGSTGAAVAGTGGAEHVDGSGSPAGTGVEAVGGNTDQLGTGGTGLIARGGHVVNGVQDGRSGGNGVSAFGGDGSSFGYGGPGVTGSGGSVQLGGPVAATPGTGVLGGGGPNFRSTSAIGGTGVEGFGGSSSNTFSLTGIGVRGESTTNHGVLGVSATGAGVRGESSGTAGSQGVAVEGLNNSTANPAIRGINSGSGRGIFGQSSTGVGIRGVSFGASAAGTEGVASGAGPGVWGFANAGHGVLGNSTSGNGGVFSSSSGYALSAQTTTGAVGLFVKGNVFSVQAQGNLTCTGSGDFDGGIVVASRMADGSRRATSAVTSPDAVVEDFGRARLVNGAARVELDRQFASLINTADYAVFPVPRGDCKGLYLASQSATGFEIRELQAGSSSIDFDYRIVAKRTGTAALARFAKVDEPPPPPRFPEMPELPTPESTSRTPASPSSAPRSGHPPTRSSRGGSPVGAPAPRR